MAPSDAGGAITVGPQVELMIKHLRLVNETDGLPAEPRAIYARRKAVAERSFEWREMHVFGFLSTAAIAVLSSKDACALPAPGEIYATCDLLGSLPQDVVGKWGNLMSLASPASAREQGCGVV